MKKNIYTIITILFILLFIIIFISSINSTSISSNYSINYTWLDKNQKYVTDIEFDFNNIKEEKESQNILLNSDGYIKVENLESENKCIIKILDNKNNLINTYTLTKNCILKNVVNVDGKYKLLLILKPGEGRGKISIINNESTD